MTGYADQFADENGKEPKTNPPVIDETTMKKLRATLGSTANSKSGEECMALIQQTANALAALAAQAAEIERLREREAALEKALREIAEWKMPATGRFHPNGTEMSYSRCFGSNGERDVIRNIARAALGEK